MTKTVKVAIQWPIGGLSNHSPRGQRFALPVRFDHQNESWLDDAWSLLVEVEGVPDSRGHQIGQARFLMPDGPHHWLTVGKCFTLYEGSLPVAVGRVTAIS